MEHIDGLKIMQGIRTLYEFVGYHFHGHTLQPFRDVIAMSGDTLAVRYERTMSRLEQITRAGNLLKFQWECEFDDAGIVKDRNDILAHRIVLQIPFRTRNTLYGSKMRSCVYTRRHVRMKLYNMLTS